MTQFEEITSRALNTKSEIDERANQILNLFRERVKLVTDKLDLTKQIFSVSGDSPLVEIYVIGGDKVVGSNYDLTTWKTVPIFKQEIDSFSDGSGFYLITRINFAGSSGSEDWRKSSDDMADQMDKAINNAIKDFIQSSLNTL